MWRLMYAMIAVTDAGSVAIDSNHTEWPTQQACEFAAKTLYNVPPTAVINNVRITIKTQVQCVPVDLEPAPPPPARYYAPPPPPQPPGFPAITFGPRGVRIGPAY